MTKYNIQNAVSSVSTWRLLRRPDDDDDDDDYDYDDDDDADTSKRVAVLTIYKILLIYK